MTIYKYPTILGMLLLTLLVSCSPDEELYIIPPTTADDLLEEKLISLYGNLNELTLPLANELDKIPSDPKNPITASKVLLGKLLFHETGLGQNPRKEIGTNTYSCASCHQSKAGFQSGIKQGIGEGGEGFGLFGEGRHIASNYLNNEVDTQPIRSPTILNTAYQDVMLWNGQFGATKTNAGTEAHWTPETPKEKTT